MTEFENLDLLHIVAGVLLFALAAALGCWLEMNRRKWHIYNGIFAFGTGAVLALAAYIPPYLEGTYLCFQNSAAAVAGLLFGAPAVFSCAAVFACICGMTDGAAAVPAILSFAMAALIGYLIRTYIFGKRPPHFLWGLLVGLFVQVFHMLLLMPFTEDPIAFFEAEMADGGILGGQEILGSALSVAASLLTASFLLGDDFRLKERGGKKSLTRQFQTWLMICTAAAFALTGLSAWYLHTNMAELRAEEQLERKLTDAGRQVSEAADRAILINAHAAAAQITPEYYVNEGVVSFYNHLLEDLKTNYNVSELNIIDKTDHIISTTTPEFYMFDMQAGPQSSSFMYGIKNNVNHEMTQPYMPISYGSNIRRKYGGVMIADGNVLQVAYSGDDFRTLLAGELSEVISNQRVGNNGGLMIISETGTIISDTNQSNGADSSAVGLPKEELSREAGTLYSGKIYGSSAYWMTDTSEGYTIVAWLPEEEVFLTRDISTTLLLFVEMILFMILFFAIYTLMRNHVVDEISDINRSLSMIRGGNLSEKIDVRSSAEFSSLSDDINATVDALEGYIAGASARLDKDLATAKNIQENSLISVFPESDEFDIFAIMHPARQVGGDFYDFFNLPDGRLAFLTADVSGKGLAAAMFMMNAKALIKSACERGGTVASIFREANDKMCENNDTGMSVSVWLGALDLASGELSFVNAGQPLPYIRKNGAWQVMENTINPPVGKKADAIFEEGHLILKKDDVIFLTNDGLADAENAKGETYGTGRIEAALRRSGDGSMKELVYDVREDAGRFMATTEQIDDITILGLKYFRKEQV